MRNLRNVIARKRPMPSSSFNLDDEDGTIDASVDLDALRAQLIEEDAWDEPEDDGETEEPAPFAAEAADAGEDAPAEAACDERPAPARPASPQIWDLDADEDAAEAPAAEAPPAAPAPKPVPARPAAAEKPEAPQVTGRSRVVPERTAPAPAARPQSARVKTRIIGLGAGDTTADIFAASKAAPSSAGQFPAGWIVVVEGPGRGASFSVAAGVSTIGRDAAQTISLDFGDTSVSRENHASIAYDEEQNRFFVGHGGKSNIVRRNGNPVLTTEDLAHGDLIRIGKTTLRFVALCGPDFTWAPETDTQGDDDTDA